MKKASRLLCLALCLVMIISVLAACGGEQTADSGNEAETIDLSGGTVTGGGVVIGDGDGTPSVDTSTDKYEPSGNDYNGMEFIVLVSNKDSTVVNMFEYKEEDQTVLNSAIHRKNENVKADYNVTFATVADVNGANGAQNMLKAYQSGTLDYHLSYLCAYDVVGLATQGVLYDLNKLDGVNLKNSWWDQRANIDLSINDQMYFTTGDIDVWDDMQQNIMMFNRSLFTAEVDGTTVEDLYSLVEQGKWTYDKFYELGRGVTSDSNGDNKMTHEDTWGMITWDDTIYAVFSSTGAKIVKNENNTLALGMIGDERSIDCMTEYTEWTSQNAYNYSRDGNGSKAIKMFQEDRALFFMGRLSSLNHYRDMQSDFGVIPVPKYSESDDYYVTVSPFHTSLVCTLSTDEQATMRGEVIESCAYYSAQECTPAYREKILEGTNIRDEGSLMTLKLCATNRIYDIGFYISPGKINGQLILLYRKWGTEFASTYEQYRAAAEQDIASVASAYAKLANQ